MGDLPFHDCLPPAAFADAWRPHDRHLPQLHPLLRAALVVASLILQLSLLALLNYHPPAHQPQQPAMVVVQLQNDRPRPRVKELALKFVRPHVAQIAAPQFTIMPDTNPAPKSPLPVTMALTSPLTGGTPQGTGTGSGAGGASSCIDTAYLAEIGRHIQQYYFYPVYFNETHLEGVVYVHFVSTRMGSYRSLEVATSSGHPTLDRAALQIMQRASPLPMIPDRLHADVVNALIPIIFALKGSNLNPTWTASGSC